MKNDFENKIDKFIKKLNDCSGFGWKNHPGRNHQGQYLEDQGEKFDYCIITSFGLFCFDAKMTKQDTWKLLSKDLRQAKNLYQASFCNDFVKSFFIIYFEKIKEYRIIFIKEFIEITKERKHIKISDCEKIKLEELIFNE